MKASGNTILITGGGSGIGAAFARRLHDSGNVVIIAGRRQAALDAVAEGHENIHAIAVDVDDAAAVKAFAADLVARFPALNVLINNAGVMRVEDITASRDLADAEATITTNLLGPIRMTDALIDQLTAQLDAAIVNISSGLAFVPLRATPTYSATKAALHSYTVSLRSLLQGKVEVIELPPPAVQTELTPGQSTRPHYMPLDAFADEAIGLLLAQPTPPEVLVQNVMLLRNAEREGRFDQTVAMINESAERARRGDG